MTLGCYIASMDGKLAYYSVPISKDHQIRMFSQLFCILFPNVSVQIYSVLRRRGYLSSPYIDELWGLCGNYHCHNRNVYIPWVLSFTQPRQYSSLPRNKFFQDLCLTFFLWKFILHWKRAWKLFQSVQSFIKANVLLCEQFRESLGIWYAAS